MFDKETILIHVPAGPYPKCNSTECMGKGTMLPRVEPATSYVERGPEGVHGCYERWQEGTAILFWKCDVCGKRVD